MKQGFNIIIFLCLIGAPLSLGSIGAGDSIQVLIKSFFWLITIGALILTTAKNNALLYINSRNPIYTYLVVLLLSSVFSLVAYGFLVSGVLIVFTIYSAQIYLRDLRSNKSSLFNSVLFAFLFLTLINCILGLLGLTYIVSEGYQRLSGVVGQASQASQIAAVTLLLVIFSNLKKLIKLTLAVICFYVLFEAGGRTIILGLAISLIFWANLDLKKIKKVTVVLILFGASFPFITTAVIDDNIALLMQGMESFARTGNIAEIYTLSGRVPLWNAVTTGLLDNWLFGIGYGASKDILPLVYETRWGWSTDSAHNAYLHVFFESGVIGFLGVVYLLISLVRLSADKNHVCVLLFISILSVMSSTFAGPGVSILMFLLSAVSIMIYADKSLKG